MSYFSEKVLASGLEASLARACNYKQFAYKAQEEQRLLYLNATDDEINELTQFYLRKFPNFKGKALVVRAWLCDMRERACDKQAWHAQYKDREP